MKIRTGFVSNSSSSSFVVAFPHKPKDVADLKEMLFGKQEWHFTGYVGEHDSDASTQTISENVFRKIKKEATIEDMVESIVHGWFGEWYGLPGRYDRDEDPKAKRVERDDPKRREKLDEQWKVEEVENQKRANAIMVMFKRMYEDKYFVVMSFSDNSGEAVEEHSGIFERVESIRTSYH